MAYLKPLQVYCDVHNCTTRATDELYSHDNTYFGKFCPRHGTQRQRSMQEMEEKESKRRQAEDLNER